MKSPDFIPVMPCGFTRTGKLKEHLAHYRKCSDPACQERIQKWEDLKTAARADMARHMQKKA